MSAKETLDRIIYKKLQRLFILTLICLSVCYLAGFVYIYTQVKKVEYNFSYLDFGNRHSTLNVIGNRTLQIEPFTGPDQKAIDRLNTSITTWQSSFNALKQRIQKVQTKKQSASTLAPFFEDYFKASESTIA